MTADAGDRQIDRAVRDVLQLAREHLRMDVAFVSKFERGQRVFRQVDPDDGQQVIAAGGADPLEMSFCQRVIDGRLPEMVTDVTKLPDFAELPATPFRIGAHLSTPICLADGLVYGTLCCFSFAPDDSLRERDLKRLRMAAELVARLIDSARSRNAGGNSPPH
ncbi:MAG: GAF domain-containing protein [Variovorax sp.]